MSGREEQSVHICSVQMFSAALCGQRECAKTVLFIIPSSQSFAFNTQQIFSHPSLPSSFSWKILPTWKWFLPALRSCMSQMPVWDQCKMPPCNKDMKSPAEGIRVANLEGAVPVLGKALFSSTAKALVVPGELICVPLQHWSAPSHWAQLRRKYRTFNVCALQRGGEGGQTHLMNKWCLLNFKF